ncbi:putative ubiquitin-conjugating enzyme E2 23 [Orobanche hederae]
MLAFVYSRTAMVHDALVVLSKMKDFNIQPSVMTYNSLLHNLRETDIAWDIYTELEDNGPSPTDCTNSIFLDGLCRQSLILEAIAFLREINEKDAEPFVVCFNTLIMDCVLIDIVTLFSFMGSLEEPLAFALDMEKHGLHPDQVTYNILAKGFRLLSMNDGVWKVPKKMLQSESDPDLLSYTILICGHCQSDGDVEPDLFLYSMINIIHGLCKLGEVEKAVQLYKAIFPKRVYPSSFPHRSILLGLCEKRTTFEARCYLNTLTRSGLIHDVVLYNIMIDRYIKVGDLAEAVRLYENLLKKGIDPTVVTFNTLINGLCKAGKLDLARKWLDDMKMLNVVPAIVTYTTIMNAFCEVGNLKATFELLTEMTTNGLEPNHITCIVLMKGLCKRRKLEESLAVLQNMLAKGLSPGQTSYNALSAYVKLGTLKEHFYYMMRWSNVTFSQCFSDGDIEVTWADGMISTVGPQVIYVVGLDDNESMATGSDGDDDAASWETADDDADNVNPEEHGMENAVDSGIEIEDDPNGSEYSGKSGALSLPLAAIGFMPRLASGIFSRGQRNSDPLDIDIRNEDDLQLEGLTLTRDRDSGSSSQKAYDMEEHLAKPTTKCKEEHDAAEASLLEIAETLCNIKAPESNDLAREEFVSAFRGFDIVRDHLDHHFLGAQKQGNATTKWLKKVNQDCDILQNNLPEGIYVRIYEDGMDLLRVAIVGAYGTPYQDEIFLFDFHLPPDYPDVLP